MKLIFFSILILSFSSQSYALGKIFPGLTKTFKGKNKRNKTEAGMDGGCTHGDCPNRNNLRSEPVAPIPQKGNLGHGALRVLTTLYGTCAAKHPTRGGLRKHPARRRSAYVHLEAVQDKNAKESNHEVHVPGFKEENRSLRKIKNPKQFLKNGPYGAAISNNVKMCRRAGFSPAVAPKAFGMGSGGKMVNGEYNLFQCGDPAYFNKLTAVQKAYRCGLAPDSKPAVTLDCAEFIGAASIASCQKLHPNQKVGKKGFRFGKSELSTGQLVRLSKDSKSCLTNSPIISAQSSIQPGDIFAGSGTHSMTITHVGVDPLGIGKARRRGNCNITYKDLNFGMAHSPSFAALGPINSTARAYVEEVHGNSGVTPYPLNKIVAMARVMCRKRGKAGAATMFIQKPRKKNQNLARVEGKEDRSFALIRHRKNKAGCKYSPKDCPKITGDECADKCGL